MYDMGLMIQVYERYIYSIYIPICIYYIYVYIYIYIYIYVYITYINQN